jgi:cytoskeletal protein RodZ
MRAREFIYEFAPPGLAGTLKQTIDAAKQSQQPQNSQQQNPSPNQTKTPSTSQGSQGTANAQQATTGGTQTPQNGLPNTGSPTQPKQPMGQQSSPATANQRGPDGKPLGVMGGFISGLTGGKANSLGGAAGLAAGKALGGLGMNKTASAIGTAMEKPDQYGNSPITPQELQTTLKQGSTIKIPGQDDFKVGKIDNTGIELTGNKLGKVKVDLKSLAGQK